MQLLAAALLLVFLSVSFGSAAQLVAELARKNGRGMPLLLSVGVGVLLATGLLALLGSQIGSVLSDRPRTWLAGGALALAALGLLRSPQGISIAEPTRSLAAASLALASRLAASPAGLIILAVAMVDIQSWLAWPGGTIGAAAALCLVLYRPAIADECLHLGKVRLTVCLILLGMATLIGYWA